MAAKIPIDGYRKYKITEKKYLTELSTKDLKKSVAAFKIDCKYPFKNIQKGEAGIKIVD